MVRTRKELAIFLSKLKGFENPHIQLEQYPSDGDVAAKLLWQAMLDGNIEDKTILDLGCGTGILGIGALLLGAKHIIFVDIDASVQKVLKENIAFVEEEYEFPGTYEFKNSDVKVFKQDVDTVIMNPPFGTKLKHADKAFLETAKWCAPWIYSMHKTTTKGFLQAYVDTNNLRMVWQEDTSFPIKNMYKEHRKKIERIEVTLICLNSLNN